MGIQGHANSVQLSARPTNSCTAAEALQKARVTHAAPARAVSESSCVDVGMVTQEHARNALPVPTGSTWSAALLTELQLAPTAPRAGEASTSGPRVKTANLGRALHAPECVTTVSTTRMLIAVERTRHADSAKLAQRGHMCAGATT